MDEKSLNELRGLKHDYYKVIDKNQEYNLVLEFLIDEERFDSFYKEVKDIIETIKLK